MKYRYLIAFARQPRWDYEHPDWDEVFDEVEGWSDEIEVFDPQTGKELSIQYLEDGDNPEREGFFPMSKADQAKWEKKFREDRIKSLEEELKKLRQV